jgi:low affinity Fe/Cu permease
MQMKEESKATKKRAGLITLFKLLVFAAVIWTLYFQLRNVDWEHVKGLDIKHWWALVLAFLLLIPNLWMEFLKWKKITDPLHVEPKLVTNAFWAGVASGFMSPNGWGNFLGRLIYFQKRQTIYIIFSTALANLSQLIPTLLFGLFAVLLKYGHSNSLWIATSLGAVLILLLYFFGDYLLPQRRSRISFVRRLQSIRGRYQNLKWPFLLFSTIRFLVFSLQYALLFVTFGYEDIWFLMSQIWLIYLFTSFIPSLWSGKVLIRETAALFVFAGTVVSVPDVIVSSIIIYLINIALPAFMSSFIWLPKRKK